MFVLSETDIRMITITMSVGESLADLLKRSGNVITFNSGIWIIEEGSLQKRSLRHQEDKTSNITDNYSILNIYTKGDYFMGDSDMVIDYFALESTTIRQVQIDKVDPVKLLFQLDALEEYVHYTSYSDREDSKNNRIANFFTWIRKKLKRPNDEITHLLTQEEIGRMTGLHRTTVNRKLKMLHEEQVDSSNDYT